MKVDEEPWDELMGPPDEDVRQTVLGMRENGTPSAAVVTPEPLVRSTSLPAPQPPPTAFHGGLPSRWAQMDPPVDDDKILADEARGGFLTNPYTQRRTRSLPIEDEEDDIGDEEDSAADYLSSNGDAERGGDIVQEHERSYSRRNDYANIRQEALKMLEVADSQLAGSSYSVYRTVSGGFMASAEPIGNVEGSNKKRIPSALKGLKYTAARSRRFRDDPFATSEGVISSKTTSDDYEYGDEDAVLDAMERRAASSQPDSSSSSSSTRWSSRYSIDNTLLALSGSSLASTPKSSSWSDSANLHNMMLDRFDMEHKRERQAKSNLFGSDNPVTGSNVFGSGFEFRQKFVFGKQGVTVPSGSPTKPQQQANLLTAFNDERSSLPPASPRKSWQDQVAKRQRQRRHLVVAAAIAFVVFITLASVLGYRNRTSTSSLAPSTDANVSQDALTFYVTSDVPYSYADEKALTEFLDTSISPDARFLVHLGNIQQASVTLCQPSRYPNVAKLLQKSPIPTFVLPGQEDWANCPDPQKSWGLWAQSFSYFEQAFDHHPDTPVGRQLQQLENFAFVESGVLMIGVHVVASQNETATVERNKNNMDWVRYMTTDMGRQSRAVVVLGNGRPGMPEHKEFFEMMSTFLQAYGKPAVYVHANSGGGVVEERKPFLAAPDILSVQASQGGRNVPLRISVGTGSRPFTISS